MAQIQDAMDQARNAFSQLTSQAGNVVNQGLGAVNHAVNTPMGPNHVSVSQAVQQTAPHVAQDFGNMFRQGFAQVPQNSSFSQTPHGQAYNQIVGSVNKAIQPILNNVANTAQTVGSGAVDTVMGAGRVVNDPSLLGKAAGAAQSVYGVGKNLAAATPLFQGANAVSSLTPRLAQADLPRRISAGVMQGMTGVGDLAPNVPNQNTNLPFFGQTDLAKAAGNFAGFAKNPVNNKLFESTAGISLPITNKVASFVVNTGLKGGIENTLMNLGNMPTNLNPNQKAQYLINNFGLGAAMNVGAQGAFKGAGAIGEKVGESSVGNFTKEQMSGAYDALQQFIQKHNTPVKTMEMNEQTGQFITRPLWQQHIMDQYKQALANSGGQGGYINFGEIGDAITGKQPSGEESAVQTNIPEEIPQPKVPSLTEGHQLPTGMTSSGNPLTGQEFQQSLESPSETMASSMPSLPTKSDTLSPPPLTQQKNLPEGSLQSAIPGDLQTPPQSPEQTPATPQTPQSSLSLSSDGSISSPVKQQQVNDLFAHAKITQDTPISQSHELVKAVADIFDPVAGTVQGADITNAFRDHRGVFDHAVNLAQRDSLDLTNQWQKVSAPDHLKFIQGIESGNPIDIKGIDPQVAQKYQQRFADDYAIQKSIRPDAPYRENYFTQSGMWKDPQKASEFYSQWQKASLGGSKGFFEQRTFPTVLDGVKAGLELKETNPETLYLNNHTQVLKAKMADDFAKEMQSKEMDQSLVQKVIDRYMDPGIAGNAIYKTAQSANAALNSAQLGLSAFHFTTTTMNSFTSKMAQGIEELSQGRPLTALKDIASTPLAPLQQLLRGNKMLADAFANNPELSTDVQNVLTAGGKFSQDEAYKSGAWNGMMKNIREGKAIPAALKAPFAALEKVSSPLMDYYVPRLKLGAFADLASSKLQNLGENATKEQQRAALSQAWDSIDNRFGQLVQDNLLWNKTGKDLLNLSTRSLGWNVGTVRELGGGAVNALKAPKQIMSGQGIDSSTAYMLSLPIMTGIASTVYSYLHGHSPDMLDLAGYARTGQIKYPKPGSPDQNAYPERVSIPGYQKDEIAFAKNPVSTVINKTSPIVNLAAKAVELGQTGGIKDYFGDTVVDPNATPVEKAKQIAQFGGSQFLPFSVSGQRQREGTDLGTKIESGLGFTPAPAAITKGANADLMNQSFNEKLTPQQSKEMFQLQQQGINPQNYIKSVTDQRAQTKAQKTAGTDLTSQKDAAIKSYLQTGDSSQAQRLGLTAQGMKSFVNSRMISAADALVAGDQKTAQNIMQTYQHPIPPKVLMRSAHDRALNLIQTAYSFQKQGNQQDATKLLDQVDVLKKNYPFQLTQQDKLQIMGSL